METRTGEEGKAFDVELTAGTIAGEDIEMLFKTKLIFFKRQSMFVE